MKTMPGAEEKESPAAASESARTRLAVNARKLIGRDVTIGAQRIYIGIRAARGRIVNRLGPVDPERRVHGRDHILNPRLLLMVPAGVDNFVAVLIAFPEHQPALNARAREHRRKRILVMVAARHRSEEHTS